MADLLNDLVVIKTSNQAQALGIPSGGDNTYFVLKGPSTNTNPVYWGKNPNRRGDGLTATTGFPLGKGEITGEIYSNDGNQLYVYGTAGDALAWYCVNP